MSLYCDDGAPAEITPADEANDREPAAKVPRTREFTAEELEELEDDAVCIATQPWRHGHEKTFVAAADGTHWRFRIKVHHEGWQFDDWDRVIATEVHQVERITKVWVPK